jgi:hypothetical protein
LIIGVTGLNAASEPAAGYGVLKSLKGCGDHDLVGLAYEPLETCMYQSDLMKRVYLLPFPGRDSGEYLKRLLQIKSNTGMDILIPNQHREIPFLIEHVPALDGMGIKTLLPQKQSLRDIFKGEPGDNLKELAVSFRLPSTEGSDDRISILSLGKAPVQNMNVFRNIASEEFAIGLLADRNHQIAGSVSIKKLLTTPGGSTWMGLTIGDEEFNNVAEEIVGKTAWTGPMTINMTRNERGIPCVRNVLPVFPDWINFAATAGMNLPAALVAIIQGEYVPPVSRIIPGKLFVRMSIDVVTDIDRFGIFSLTGEMTYD